MKLEALPVLRPWSHSVAVHPGMWLFVQQAPGTVLKLTLTSDAGTAKTVLEAPSLAAAFTLSPDWWKVTAGEGSNTLLLSVSPTLWEEFLGQCRRLQAEAAVDDLPW